MTTRHPRARLLAAAAATAVLLSGCTPRPAHPAPSRPAPSAPGSTAAPSSAPTDQQGDDGAGPTTSASPTDAALHVAVVFMTAWARPNLDQTTWLAAVIPNTTPEYAATLSSVDPANVPARHVTGPPRSQASTADAALVDVPTDAGPIRVSLVQRDGRWLVADVAPAQDS
jgi:hypothetical protein